MCKNCETTDGAIADSRLKTFLQKFLFKRPKYRKLLMNLAYCGSQVNHNAFKKDNYYVALVVNEATKRARIVGTISCRSSWACPRCSAKQMANYGARIASAIDALSTWYKQSACMITFTLPHTAQMSCSETYTILEEAWRMFVRQGNHRGRKCTDRNSDKRRGNDAYGGFREDLQVKHHVRIYEFTWGVNSWHPHIHALFWIPNDLFNKVADYEKSLVDRWIYCCETCAKKVLTRLHPDSPEHVKAVLERCYNEQNKKFNALYLSKDQFGTPLKMQSSYYISGWSGDQEVTCSYKQAKPGHYTPWQILQKAHDLRHSDPTKSESLLELFAEYAMTTLGHRRVQFAPRTGLSEIIRKWQQTQGYVETLKKKATDKAHDKWHVVCWFTKEQWLTISCSDIMSNTYIVNQLLRAASRKRARLLIRKILAQIHMELSYDQYARTPYAKHIEKYLSRCA